MDRESYESPEVADILNSRFVAVKVDRDERPDVDARYQTAVAAISGQGGWPLTVFLTPEGKPFYGGTYFPPEDAFGRPSFKRILMAISQAFTERREEVEKESDGLMHALAHAEGMLGRSADFSPKIVEQMVQSGLGAFDRENGGFGHAPKFPHPAALDLLLDWYARTREEQVGTVVVTSLTKMAQGGVYDQLAGGFHRYSVDERWCVPHFEKMAYDNSELLKNYAHGYLATGNPFFAHIARDIVRWMDEWLSDRERGGFYGSQDADINLHDDGDHFTWTVDEARAVLTEEELEVAGPHYDLEERGEMHHNPAKNVLWVRASVEEIASRTGKSRDEVTALLDSAKRKMYAARLQRPIPYVDKTLYTNWNALCIAAYFQTARALAKPGDDSSAKIQDFAVLSLERLVLEAWHPEQGLSHIIAYAEGEARQRPIGMLDDYAYTVLACLDAYENTSDLRWFRTAEEIAERMISGFYDETGGGFFDVDKSTMQDAVGALTARRKPFQDAPTPAGDSSAAIAMLRLHALTNNGRYRELAEDTMEVFAGVAEQFGIYAGTYGIAAVWLGRPHAQVVVVGDGPEAEALYYAAQRPFALNRIVLRARSAGSISTSLPPAIAELISSVPALQDGQPVAIVCSGFTCQPPVRSAEQLAEVLRAG